MYQKEANTDGCWHSSTGVSPRPMLVGAARNALWAFNARVSLTCLYVVARKLPRLLCGLVWIARSWEVMAHRPYGSIQNRMYPSPYTAPSASRRAFFFKEQELHCRTIRARKGSETCPNGFRPTIP